MLNPNTRFQGICGDRATPRSPGPSTTPRPRHQTVSPVLRGIPASAVSLSPDHSGAAPVLRARGSSTEARVTEHSGGGGGTAAPPQTRATLHVSQGLPPGNRRLWSASALGRCPPPTHRAGHRMEANKPLPPRSSKEQAQPTGAHRPGPAARRLPRWQQHGWPGLGSHRDRASRRDIAGPQIWPSSTCKPVSPSLGPKRPGPGAPTGAMSPTPTPTDRLGDLEHVTSLGFPICKLRAQRRCLQGSSSTTQWSADPSIHWAQPGPAVRIHTCLLGRSFIHPPNTSYLCPAQHPLPQLPTRPAGPLEPQPRCRPGLQLGPGHGGVGEAGGSTAAPGSRSAPCPVQEGYVGVPREGVKGREKGLHTIPEQASARSAGKERVSRQAP